MENQSYCVYMHTNKINNKKYVGITSRNVQVRWQNGKGYKRQPKFYAAIQKYGWDGFDHEILFNGLTLEEANAKERELIKFYDSIGNGYNLTEGGDGSLGCLHTREAKQKMSESRKGREITDEWRRHLSEALKGRPCPTKGKELSKEHKSKISQSVKQYYKNNKQSHEIERNKFPSVAVICENQEFQSIKDCAKFYGVEASLMSRWLNGDTFIPKEFVEKRLCYKNIDANYVLCELRIKQVYYDGKIYQSLNECSKATGHCVKTLKNWIEKNIIPPVDIYLVPVHKYKIINNN